MAGRESAEDKFRALAKEVFGEMLDERERRSEESKNPAFAQLRRMMREEFQAVLGELLHDPGDAEDAPGRRRSGNRRATDDEGDGPKLGILGL